MHTRRDAIARGKDIAETQGEFTHPEDIASSIYDSITDLLHYAHSLELEPDEMFRMARLHFDSEVVQPIDEELQA